MQTAASVQPFSGRRSPADALRRLPVAITPLNWFPLVLKMLRWSRPPSRAAHQRLATGSRLGFSPTLGLAVRKRRANVVIGPRCDFIISAAPTTRGSTSTEIKGADSRCCRQAQDVDQSMWRKPRFQLLRGFQLPPTGEINRKPAPEQERLINNQTQRGVRISRTSLKLFHVRYGG